MDNSINLIAFGTFGNPNGFKQTFFVGSKDLEKGVKTFDLNTNAIKLFPRNKIYAIRKEYAEGFNTIAYVVYSFAKEQNSDRSGTFIGSGILFTNKIPEEHITIGNLNEFHENLIVKNVQNDIILVNHSDNFSVNKPKDFDKTEFYFKAIEGLNFTQLSNKNLVVYSEIKPDKLQILLKKSIDLLNVYDTIYFTDSEDIATFVHQKGIFKLIQANDLEQELQILDKERKRKTESSILEFEKEKQKLEDDRKRIIEDYKQQIQRSEKSHFENGQRINESKNDLDVINNSYVNFSKKIDGFITQLQSGKKIEEVRRLYNENKGIFINSVNQQKSPNFVSTISKPNAKSNLQIESQEHYSYKSRNNQMNQPPRGEKRRINIFKIISCALFFLWIGTLIYFFLIEKKVSSNSLENQQKKAPMQQPIQIPPIPD